MALEHVRHPVPHAAIEKYVNINIIHVNIKMHKPNDK